MVGRATLCSRINTLKTKSSQVEFIDENVDYSDWIFFGDGIVQALRQQYYLRPTHTFDESLHDRPRFAQKIRSLHNHRRFHTAWVESRFSVRDRSPFWELKG
jgi:hypothetical protein